MFLYPTAMECTSLHNLAIDPRWAFSPNCSKRCCMSKSKMHCQTMFTSQWLPVTAGTPSCDLNYSLEPELKSLLVTVYVQHAVSTPLYSLKSPALLKRYVWVSGPGCMGWRPCTFGDGTVNVDLLVYALHIRVSVSLHFAFIQIGKVYRKATQSADKTAMNSWLSAVRLKDIHEGLQTALVMGQYHSVVVHSINVILVVSPYDGMMSLDLHDSSWRWFVAWSQ